MTQEEKLEEAKRLYETANADQRYVLESLFPELAESEDEVVRKELLQIVKENEDSFYMAMTPDKRKHFIAWLEKRGEQKPAEKPYTFKAIPRLLDMIEPTSKSKAYCQKLINTLISEGYNADAKIVGECLKQMNGEKVPMATMDEQKPAWSEKKKKEKEKDNASS